MIGLAVCLITIPAGRGSQNLRNQSLQLSNKDADNPGKHDRKFSVSLDRRLPLYSKAMTFGAEFPVKLVLTSGKSTHNSLI